MQSLILCVKVRLLWQVCHYLNYVLFVPIYTFIVSLMLIEHVNDDTKVQYYLFEKLPSNFFSTPGELAHPYLGRQRP
jgi:hypothetical protein